MSNKLFTLTEAHTNKSAVFREIYSAGEISRQEIAAKVGLSLPTLRQSVNELLKEGLICENGYFESTGGRKASAFSVSPKSMVAVGVEFLGDSVQLSAVDLRGMVILEKKHKIRYSDTDEYYRKFGELVNAFVSELGVSSNHILEILIAVQGIVSLDGERILMGKVLGNSGTSRAQFQKYIRYPCRLVNDTDAAAFGELWSSPDISNAAFLLLNRNLGGAIIINGRVFHGRAVDNKVMNGGIIGHLHIVPGGKPCYCGKCGCFQAYCSVNTLEEESGTDIDSFMRSLKKGNVGNMKIFDRYLSYLAFGINNIRTLMDLEFIIGGYLEEYLTDEHFALLSEKVKNEAPFDNMTFQYRRSVHGAMAPSRGAAYIKLNDFILSI